jgi:hypothetical protein
MAVPQIKWNLDNVQRYLGIQKGTRVDIENAARSGLQAVGMWGSAATGKDRQAKFETVYNHCFEQFSTLFISTEPEGLKREAVKQCILIANTRQRRKAGDGNKQSVKQQSAEPIVQQSSNAKSDASASQEALFPHQSKFEPGVHDPTALKPSSPLKTQNQAQHNGYVFGLTTIIVARLEDHKWGELYMPLSLVEGELRTTLTDLTVQPKHTSFDMLIQHCKEDGLLKAQDEELEIDLNGVTFVIGNQSKLRAVMMKTAMGRISEVNFTITPTQDHAGKRSLNDCITQR